jgi:hypothetical protein
MARFDSLVSERFIAEPTSFRAEVATASAFDGELFGQLSSELIPEQSADCCECRY